MDVRVLEFETRYSPSGKAVDWVHLTNRGAFSENGQLTHSTWRMVKTLVPPENVDNEGKVLAMRYVWDAVGPAYEAWKAGNEMPETGTPLAAWSGVSAAQAEVFKRAGARTIEDIASLGDDIIGKIPLPNARDIKRQAAAWLESRSSEEMAAKVTEMEDKYNAALEMIEAMRAEKDEAKPRRGRPPKNVEAA